MIAWPFNRTAAGCFAAALIIFLAGCSDDEPPGYLHPGSLILAFGDSITYGTGAPLDADYPNHLFKLTGLGVVNAGIPGDTVAEARKRLGGLLELHSPNMVIIELGGNDFLARRSEDAIKQELKAMIEQSQAAGSTVLLVAIPRLSLLRAGTGTLKDAALYEELAEETGAILLDDVVSDILSQAALRSDPIHPNSSGYQALAEGIVARLREEELLPPAEEE